MNIYIYLSIILSIYLSKLYAHIYLSICLCICTRYTHRQILNTHSHKAKERARSLDNCRNKNSNFSVYSPISQQYFQLPITITTLALQPKYSVITEACCRFGTAGVWFCQCHPSMISALQPGRATARPPSSSQKPGVFTINPQIDRRIFGYVASDASGFYAIWRFFSVLVESRGIAWCSIHSA